MFWPYFRGLGSKGTLLNHGGQIFISSSNSFRKTSQKFRVICQYVWETDDWSEFGRRHARIYKGLSIYYELRDGGRGLPDLLKYYIGGGVSPIY